MRKIPKILVATTIYDKKHYAFPKWWKAVKELSYPSYGVLIVDNTADNGNYARKLRRIIGNKGKVIHAERKKNSRDTLSYCQNIIRQRVIDEDYDYWMSIESDIVPPSDTIQRLLQWGQPVVGGLYEIGHDVKRLCVFLRHDKGNGTVGTRLITAKEDEEIRKTKGLIKIHGCGIGCALIRRDILERFPFWTDERFDNKHSDVYFYMDLDNNKIPVYVDTTIFCEHYNSDWGKVEDR